MTSQNVSENAYKDIICDALNLAVQYTVCPRRIVPIPSKFTTSLTHSMFLRSKYRDIII